MKVRARWTGPDTITVELDREGAAQLVSVDALNIEATETLLDCLRWVLRYQNGAAEKESQRITKSVPVTGSGLGL